MLTGGEVGRPSTVGSLWAGHAISQLVASDSFGWSVFVSI